MHRARLALTFGLGLALAAPALAARPYALGGASSAQTPNSSAWNWENGSALNGFRAALLNPANFGPSGVVERPITSRVFNDINIDNLALLDGIIATWWADADISAAEREAVFAAFVSGKDLIVFQDDSLHDPIGERLGLPSLGSSSSVNNGTSFLYNGPFGAASNVQQSGNFASLDAAAVAATGGTVVSTNANGQITGAFWDRGRYSPNAGRLLILTDVDMVSSNTATYASENSNGRFALNAIARFVQDTYVLAGLTEAATLDSSTWNWETGTDILPFRNALDNNANFGRRGTFHRDIQTRVIPGLSTADLAGVDGLVVNWWSDFEFDSAARAQVINYLRGGGNLMIFQDDADHDPIGEVLGVTTSESIGTPSNGTSFLFDGPFGNAATVQQALFRGKLDPAQVAAAGGTVVATNTAGEITAAAWEPGQFTTLPSAGRILIVADIDMVSNRTSTYAPLNNNGRFALNAAAWFVNRSYTIAGPADSQSPNTFSYAWGTGSSMASMKAALRDVQRFGTSGPVTTDLELVDFNFADLVNFGYAGPSGLGHDAIVANWWSDLDFDAAERAAVRDFFLAGRDLVLYQDDTEHDPVGELLGIPALPSAGTPSNGTSFLFNGPFGVASNVAQAGNVGRIDPAVIAATNGRIVSTNTVGQVTAAYWERGAFSPGAGRMVVVGDVDMSAFAADYSTNNSNAIFTLNLFAQLADVVKPCSPADLVEPFGTLNIFDILEFFGRFGVANLSTDIDGNGSLNVFDILAFFDLFGRGC